MVYKQWLACIGLCVGSYHYIVSCCGSSCVVYTSVYTVSWGSVQAVVCDLLPLSLSLSLSTFRNKRLEENKYLEEKDSIRQRSAERSVSTVPVFL